MYEFANLSIDIHTIQCTYKHTQTFELNENDFKKMHNFIKGNKKTVLFA